MALPLLTNLMNLGVIPPAKVRAVTPSVKAPKTPAQTAPADIQAMNEMIYGVGPDTGMEQYAIPKFAQFSPESVTPDAPEVTRAENPGAPLTPEDKYQASLANARLILGRQLPVPQIDVQAPQFGPAPEYNAGIPQEQARRGLDSASLFSALGAIFGSPEIGLMAGARFGQGQSEGGDKAYTNAFDKTSQNYNTQVAQGERNFNYQAKLAESKAESAISQNNQLNQQYNKAIGEAGDVYSTDVTNEQRKARLAEDARKNQAREKTSLIRTYLAQAKNTHLDSAAEEAISKQLQGLGLSDFPADFVSELSPFERKQVDRWTKDRTSREAIKTADRNAAMERLKETQDSIDARALQTRTLQRDLTNTRKAIQWKLATYSQTNQNLRANAGNQLRADIANMNADSRLAITSRKSAGNKAADTKVLSETMKRIGQLERSVQTESKGTDAIRKQITDLYKNTNLVDSSTPSGLTPQGDALKTNLEAQFKAHVDRMAGYEADRVNIMAQLMEGTVGEAPAAVPGTTNPLPVTPIQRVQAPVISMPSAAPGGPAPPNYGKMPKGTQAGTFKLSDGTPIKVFKG